MLIAFANWSRLAAPAAGRSSRRGGAPAGWVAARANVAARTSADKPKRALVRLGAGLPRGRANLATQSAERERRARHFALRRWERLLRLRPRRLNCCMLFWQTGYGGFPHGRIAAVLISTPRISTASMYETRASNTRRSCPALPARPAARRPAQPGVRAANPRAAVAPRGPGRRPPPRPITRDNRGRAAAGSETVAHCERRRARVAMFFG